MIFILRTPSCSPKPVVRNSGDICVVCFLLQPWWRPLHFLVSIRFTTFRFWKKNSLCLMKRITNIKSKKEKNLFFWCFSICLVTIKVSHHKRPLGASSIDDGVFAEVKGSRREWPLVEHKLSAAVFLVSVMFFTKSSGKIRIDVRDSVLWRGRAT